MHLEHLNIINFKNITSADLHFSPRINCFLGDNGVGKTNLLDAIYYLSFCKSFFNPIDSQSVKHEEAFFVIQGQYDRKGEEEKIYCGLKKRQKKQFKRNKKEYKKLSEHIGLLPLVMVSPVDSNLIIGGSEERRKYLNGVISQFDRSYLEALMRYNRLIQHRNQLLKNSQTPDNALLDIWDEQLSHLGSQIFQKRQKFLQDLLPVFNRFYQIIAGSQEQVGLTYKSQLFEQDLMALLSESREKDKILGYTSCGIHRDDLVFTHEEHPLKKVGSQGQQKTYLVTLKLAQYEFIKKVHGIPPILLLDDIFDKLDATRVEQIVKLVSDQTFGQIFITDTNRDHLETILEQIPIENRIFQVDNGVISLKN